MLIQVGDRWLDPLRVIEVIFNGDGGSVICFDGGDEDLRCQLPPDEVARLVNAARAAQPTLAQSVAELVKLIKEEKATNPLG